MSGGWIRTRGSAQARKEIGELLDSELSGSKAGLGLGLDEFAIVRGGEVIPKCFPLLAKADGGELEESVRVRDEGPGRGIS